jgi:hypothetical protein
MRSAAYEIWSSYSVGNNAFCKILNLYKRNEHLGNFLNAKTFNYRLCKSNFE